VLLKLWCPINNTTYYKLPLTHGCAKQKWWVRRGDEIVPEVTHNLERRAAAINLGREIASLQTDNIPAGAEHVLLRCSDAQTTTIFCEL
jgi:hypothetical protein